MKMYRPSLRTRIYISMLMLVLLSSVIIGIVTVYHFHTQNEVYHKERLKRKERAIMAGIDYFLQQGPSQHNTDSIVMLFSEKICELADINKMDINIFNLDGQLLISSYAERFDNDIFVFQLNEDVLAALKSGKDRVVIEEKIDTVTALSSYTYLMNHNNQPVAIINTPYFEKDNLNKTELMSFLIKLGQIYILLVLGASILAYFLSNYITGSLKTIGEKLKHIDLGKRNEPLNWKSNDEIGALITEYNRMLAELESSAELLAKSERESAWREMAKQVAHEIKNPLTPMKLSVQHLKRSWNDKDPNWEEKLEKVTQTLIEQIDTLSAIASEFSNFAKMPKAKNERIRLAAVIRSTVELYRDTPNITLSFTSSISEDALVNADKDQISRVFSNLIKNAIQAIPEYKQGEVAVRIREEGGNLVVEVQDNGTGISEKQQANIFTPNFTTKTGGMGLGLAMVKNIVENANGYISFETKQGEGTTFFVTLPQEQDEAG